MYIFGVIRNIFNELNLRQNLNLAFWVII